MTSENGVGRHHLSAIAEPCQRERAHHASRATRCDRHELDSDAWMPTQLQQMAKLVYEDVRPSERTMKNALLDEGQKDRRVRVVEDLRTARPCLYALLYAISRCHC